MRTKEFISKLDHERIIEAIRAAEKNTSAEIRVYLQRGKLEGDALVAAQKRFQRFGMHRTDHRGSVLIYIAPRAHKFAVVGDEAIHARCGEAYWQEMVDKMREHFRNDRFSDAIVDAIRDAGETLAKYFPKVDGSTESRPTGQ